MLSRSSGEKVPERDREIPREIEEGRKGKERQRKERKGREGIGCSFAAL